MLIGTKLDRKVSCHDLLEHGEAKYVVWKPQPCVVGSHVCEHVQFVAPNHELQRTGAWNAFMLPNEVLGVKQLDDSPPRIRIFSEKLRDIGELILFSHIENARPISTEDYIVVGFLFVCWDVVRYEPDVVGLCQKPTELAQAAVWFASSLSSTKSCPWVANLEKHAHQFFCRTSARVDLVAVQDNLVDRTVHHVVKRFSSKVRRRHLAYPN